MLSITDNFLYIIDADGRQQVFDVDKLKAALAGAFENAGNPNAYLAEDIACAVESAMFDSLRSDRIFTQSEVDAAVSRILENAGYANVAQVFRRANSHLYIALDVSEKDANDLICRHLGVEEPVAGKLAAQVVAALQTLRITSASPALYLELARHYEHEQLSPLPELSPAVTNAASGSKVLLSSADAVALLPDDCRSLHEEKIIAISSISRLYPNLRLSLNLSLFAEKMGVEAPATELQMAPMLYDAGEKSGRWLKNICRHLGVETMPLYLVLTKLDIFTERYLETPYPDGRVAALDFAGLFRNALAFPVKKVRCRTSTGFKSAN